MTGSLSIRRGGSRSRDPIVAARELHAAIDQPGMSLATFYCSPDYDLDVLGAELARLFGPTTLIGCTTAGEISPLGYTTGSIAGVSLSSPDLVVATARLDDLASFQLVDGDRAARAAVERVAKSGRAPDGRNTFGLLLIDGLSNREEAVVSSLARAVGDIQLFGGSAGDGIRFGRTFVYHDGAFRSDAAIFTLVQTTHPFVVFKTQHFVSSSEKMVVTGADPGKRVVSEINGETAGREYARVVGLEVDELTPLIFSTHPVVVQIGGAYYVRSIQKVNPDESLTFFCAIDEGVVLTVARGVDLVENLRDAFAEVRAQVGAPSLVLGCDCILRHLEVEQRHLNDDVARLMAENNVVGFATYGEQFNAMHVNQTFTGVAIGGAPRG